MKFADINKKYTEKVAEYIAKGYTFNTTTMRGSQGEIAKIDLTDGKEIVRITFESKTEHVNTDSAWYVFDILKIVVGRYIGGKIAPNSKSSWDTIWNDELEVISCEKFYEIGEDFYGTREESMNKQDKHWKRYLESKVHKEIFFKDSAKEVVLSFVKRQPRCKSVKASDIEKVVKTITETGEACYKVFVKGHSYKLS